MLCQHCLFSQHRSGVRPASVLLLQEKEVVRGEIRREVALAHQRNRLHGHKPATWEAAFAQVRPLCAQDTTSQKAVLP